MQKSWLKAATLSAALLLCFTGCGQNTPNSAGQPPESSFTLASASEAVESTEPERAASPEKVATDTPVEREFGSYTVPKG